MVPYHDYVKQASQEGWTMADRISKPFLGLCDGCERQVKQMVRRVSGSWGTAVVCKHHEDHTD